MKPRPGIRRAVVGLVLGAGALAAAALASAGPVAQPTQPDRGAAIRGRNTFRTYCASCHGKEAKGDGPLATDLKAKPADLTQLSAHNDGTFPFEMVIDTIEHGRSVRGHGSQDMPAWGDAFKMTSESEEAARSKVEEIAHFLWTIQPN